MHIRFVLSRIMARDSLSRWIAQEILALAYHFVHKVEGLSNDAAQP